MTPTQGDFVAIHDVLTELAEASDSLSAEEAAMAMQALGRLASEVKRCQAMVETALKTQLEGVEGHTKVVDSVAFCLKPAGKNRYLHGRILAEIAKQAAMPDADGVVTSPYVAATRAVGMTWDLYCSQSTTPKVGALKDLGFAPKEVSSWEHTGSKIEIVDLNAPED